MSGEFQTTKNQSTSMKRSITPLASVFVLAFSTSLHAQTLWFSDNFDRTALAAGDTNLLYDIDFATNGMEGLLISSGTLSASNVWMEPVDVANTDESKSQLTNDTLQIAVGNGTSSVTLSNNFATQMTTSGVLSIQFRVPEWLANDTGPLLRFTGVGLGASLVEFTDPAAPGFGFDRRMLRVGDLFVALTQNGIVRVNDEDVSSTYRAAGVAPAAQADVGGGNFVAGTVRVDAKVSSTVAGTVVPYKVYFDSGSGFQLVISNRTFKWSGNDEIFVGIDGRSTVASPCDDFSITFTPQEFPPEVSLSAAQSLISDQTTTNEVSLTFFAAFLPIGSTYTVVADKTATYPLANNTGSAEFPFLPIQSLVDGTSGDVTFTIYISNTVPELVASDSIVIPVGTAAPSLASILFADTFDRYNTMPDRNDIDSGTGGMSGPLAPMTYLETDEGANISTTNWNDTVTVIALETNFSEVVSLAKGPVMSQFGLDHNFIDSAITNDGGFSVSVRVSSINSATSDAGDRYGGFGIGLTLAEINALQDENGGNYQGMRGAVEGATRNAGMADFCVSLAVNNQLQILAGGVLIDEIPVAANNGDLRADFGVTDFNAGSYVAYKVYYNDLLRSQGFFQWSNTDQNYVGITGRGSVNINFDDLTIGTVSVPFTPPAAHPPFSVALESLTPTTPPYTDAQVTFPSVIGTTYRADLTDSFTNAFTPAGGAIAGEAIVTATNTSTALNLDVPNGDANFIKVLPVHWQGPIQP